MAFPSPHSYLVLRGHGEDFPQGTLVALEGDEYRQHSSMVLQSINRLSGLVDLKNKSCGQNLSTYSIMNLPEDSIRPIIAMIHMWFCW